MGRNVIMLKCKTPELDINPRRQENKKEKINQVTI